MPTRFESSFMLVRRCLDFRYFKVFSTTLTKPSASLASFRNSCKRSRTSGFNGIVAKSSYSELYIQLQIRVCLRAESPARRSLQCMHMCIHA